jgi:hypothetical protein
MVACARRSRRWSKSSSYDEGKQPMAIVDEFPYPLQEPMAQELMRVMAGLYRTQREAELLTQPFGIDPLDIKPNLAPIELWHDLLTMLAKIGKVRPTVQAARDRADGNPRVPFLDALLADKPAPVSAQPLKQDGDPGFNDTVTLPEALLFFDDLTMPVGKVTTANLTGTATTPSRSRLRHCSTRGGFSR